MLIRSGLDAAPSQDLVPRFEPTSSVLHVRHDSGYSDFMKLVLQPKNVALCFFCVVVALTVANSVVQVFYFYSEDHRGYIDLFDVGIEESVPTLYSAVAIFVSSLLLAVHALVSKWTKDGEFGYWLALALIMLFLGVDEGVTIHETLTNRLGEYLDREGFLYFLWVIPYGIATAVLGLVFLRFLLRLPARTRTLFLTAGFIFVSGAIGVEVFGAREADLHGTDTITYTVLYSVEEFLEMTGIVVFIYALMSHRTGDRERLSFSLEY